MLPVATLGGGRARGSLLFPGADAPRSGWFGFRSGESREPLPFPGSEARSADHSTEPEAAAPEPPAGPGADERGIYAPFIAVIAAALVFLGGIAYDAPRIIAARQDALHGANEAARVAAATVAAGGTVEQARAAAEDRLATLPLVYGEEILVSEIECVGQRVQVTIITGYVYRSVMGRIRSRQPIEAVGAAEAVLVLPDETVSRLHYLGECALERA